MMSIVIIEIPDVNERGESCNTELISDISTGNPWSVLSLGQCIGYIDPLSNH